MVEDEKFEIKWMHTVPMDIQEAHITEDKNMIDEENLDVIGAYHDASDPFEDWRLDVEIARLEKLNKDAEEEKAQLEVEVAALEKEYAGLQKELEDI